MRWRYQVLNRKLPVLNSDFTLLVLDKFFQALPESSNFFSKFLKTQGFTHCHFDRSKKNSNTKSKSLQTHSIYNYQLKLYDMCIQPLCPVCNGLNAFTLETILPTLAALFGFFILTSFMLIYSKSQ